MLERGFLSRILFPAPAASYSEDSFPEELIWVPRGKEVQFDGVPPPPGGDCMPCLLLTYPSARFLIIFFHSNAEDLGRCRGFCCYLREQFQVHVLAVEYPGYGVCPGVPTGESVLQNALAALRFARGALHWPLDSIKVFGRSIGTGPAVALASMFSFAGLILVTPFLSIQELFRDRVGPLAGLVEEWFSNEDGAPKISSPTMIIHGQRDELITCRHGESLFKLLTCRKMMVSPPDMEHNTNLLTNLQIFVLPMFQFFALPDYVFQDMRVPSWAYREAGSADTPDDEFAVCAEEVSPMRVQPGVRSHSVGAPRRQSSAEYSSTPSLRPLVVRARSASGPRPSPRKTFKAAPSDSALAAETEEQPWCERSPPPLARPGPRLCTAPQLASIAPPQNVAMPSEPEDEEQTELASRQSSRQRNLAMDLRPEDAEETPSRDLAAALARELEARHSSPRPARAAQDAPAAAAEPATCPSASSTSPPPGRPEEAVSTGGAADGRAPGAGRAPFPAETEEALRRIAEFAGAMCDQESCSDQLIGDSESGARPREIFAAIAGQVREGVLPAPRPRGWSAEPAEVRQQLGGEAPTARQRGRAGLDDSVWTRCCGRAGPGVVDLHEARDGPQPQRRAWAAGRTPPSLEMPGVVREDGPLNRQGRMAMPFVSCCRGLPEVATDLLSPKRTSAGVLPMDEELLEQLRPAAFLLPRRKRLSI